MLVGLSLVRCGSAGPGVFPKSGSIDQVDGDVVAVVRRGRMSFFARRGFPFHLSEGDILIDGGASAELRAKIERSTRDLLRRLADP